MKLTCISHQTAAATARWHISGSRSGGAPLIRLTSKVVEKCSLGLLLSLLLMSFSAAAATVSTTLDKLSAYPALTLTCDQDEQGVDVPVPERWQVISAVADIHYTASLALDSELSQIIFLINGTPFALTRLKATEPDMRVKLQIPTQYIINGYNHLTFRVTQATKAQGCAAPCSPDKFTYINLGDSTLDIEYEKKTVPLELSSIAGFMFDPKTFPAGQVNLIMEDQSAESLTQAGIVASGIARRFDYRKVIFSVSDAPRPAMDNVVIGSTAFVQPLLEAYGLSLGTVTGGFIKIFPLPVAGAEPDPAHALIAITGQQHDHAKLAAETFANLSVNFPGSQELEASAFQVPDIPVYAGREVLEASKTYDFKTLNFPTTTFRGLNPTGKTIRFRLPSDFLIRQNLAAELVLNFSYGAGARSDSALNIVVNDTAVRAIRLGDEDGGFFKDYKVDIPTFLFKPGQNVIDMGLELHPLSDACPILPGNLFLTMYETSTLSFPDMPHFVEMPKLELFMLNGFPFTRWPDGYESLIYLPEASPDAVAAALNIVGLMTQKNGFPLLGLRIVSTPPSGWHGDMMVLGRPELLPADLRRNSPLATGKDAAVPYPIVRDWVGSYSFAHSIQTSKLGDRQGEILEFESPYEVGRSVMMIGAEQPKMLFDISVALLEPEIQGQMLGGITLIDLGSQYDKPRVTSIRAERTYTTGKGSEISMLDSFLYTHPIVFYSLLVVVIVALAWSVYFALRQYRMSRKLGRDASKIK